MDITKSTKLDLTISPARAKITNIPIVQSKDSPWRTLATIILPAYNEALALPSVLSDLLSTLDENIEILVVDDGSTDLTSEVAAQYPCRLLRHPENRGKGAAVRTGLNHASGEYIVIMDADATYPAAPIPNMIEMLCGSIDVVRCIRNHSEGNMPLINRVGNAFFNLLFTRIVRLDGVDHLSGLYALRKEVLSSMQLESDGFDLEAEISMKAHSLNLKFGYLPITYQPRIGEKKLRAWQDGWNILNRILFLILIHNPVAAFILPGVITMLLGITGAAILSRSSLVTPYFGLDIHSFILAILATLVGFQLAVLGVAASLYSIETGHQPGEWVNIIVSTPVRLGAAGLGVLIVLYSFIALLNMIIGWIVSGAGSFTETRGFVMSTTGLVGGMQLLSDVLFISIFAVSLKKKLSQGPRKI